jgi:hypothetical protein
VQPIDGVALLDDPHARASSWAAATCGVKITMYIRIAAAFFLAAADASTIVCVRSGAGAARHCAPMACRRLDLPHAGCPSSAPAVATLAQYSLWMD